MPQPFLNLFKTLWTKTNVLYPIKTLSQLSLLLKGFRKEKGLTQAMLAQRLGITQQSYAHFEANPVTATTERLFIVLRLLDVEIGLTQTSFAGAATAISPRVSTTKKKSAVPAKAGQIITPIRKKKENW